MKYLNIGHNLNTFRVRYEINAIQPLELVLISGMFIARLKFHNYLGAA